MRRTSLVLALGVVLAACAAATAIAAPQLAPGTINLSGTPTGSGTLEKDVAANFFLTKRVLGSAGRQTTAIAPARWRAFEEALDQAEPDTYPALRRAARSATTRDDDARFAGGLDLVLDAIAGRASR